jgi:hypothetical protein
MQDIVRDIEGFLEGTSNASTRGWGPYSGLFSYSDLKNIAISDAPQFFSKVFLPHEYHSATTEPGAVSLERKCMYRNAWLHDIQHAWQRGDLKNYYDQDII